MLERHMSKRVPMEKAAGAKLDQQHTRGAGRFGALLRAAGRLGSGTDATSPSIQAGIPGRLQLCAVKATYLVYLLAFRPRVEPRVASSRCLTDEKITSFWACGSSPGSVCCGYVGSSQWPTLRVIGNRSLLLLSAPELADRPLLTFCGRPSTKICRPGSSSSKQRRRREEERMSVCQWVG